MEDYRLGEIGSLLTSTDPEHLAHGLTMARERLALLTAADAGRLFEIVSALFYIDPLDHPELVPVLEDAIALVGDLGNWAIPLLIQNMEAGDVKAQMAIAQALGRMGEQAIVPLIEEYHKSCPEPGCHAFILYALGKVKSPAILQALPVALEAAASDAIELRDSATRALGKFVEVIPAGSLRSDLRDAVIAQLRANLANSTPTIRSKAVRSLGKLARFGHMTPAQRAELKVTLQSLLGVDEHYEWDRAYVVRKEAQEALAYV